MLSAAAIIGASQRPFASINVLLLPQLSRGCATPTSGHDPEHTRNHVGAVDLGPTHSARSTMQIRTLAAAASRGFTHALRIRFPSSAQDAVTQGGDQRAPAPAPWCVWCY